MPKPAHILTSDADRGAALGDSLPLPDEEVNIGSANNDGPECVKGELSAGEDSPPQGSFF